MAEREIHRGSGGRFISREQAAKAGSYLRELYENGQQVQRLEVRGALPEQVESAPAAGTNWTDQEWPGGGIVRTADGSPLTMDAFDDMPSGAASFQVRFIIPSNPDYPRGWASYSTLQPSEWANIGAILREGQDEKGAAYVDQYGNKLPAVGAIIFHYY